MNYKKHDYKPHINVWEQHNKNCPLCIGTYFLDFPDFKMINSLDIWEKITNLEVKIPIIATYCHKCFPDGIKCDNHRHDNFYQALLKYQNEEYLNLVIAIARINIIRNHSWHNQDEILKLYEIHHLDNEFNTNLLSAYNPELNSVGNIKTIILQAINKIRLQSMAYLNETNTDNKINLVKE